MTTAEKLHKDSVTISACLVLRKVVQITYCGFKTVVHVKHEGFAKNNLIKKLKKNNNKIFVYLRTCSWAPQFSLALRRINIPLCVLSRFQTACRISTIWNGPLSSIWTINVPICQRPTITGLSCISFGRREQIIWKDVCHEARDWNWEIQRHSHSRPEFSSYLNKETNIFPNVNRGLLCIKLYRDIVLPKHCAANTDIVELSKTARGKNHKGVQITYFYVKHTLFPLYKYTRVMLLSILLKCSAVLKHL